jgi:hypothetical protein
MTITAQKLAKVRVLYREPDSMSLWGIPYAMRTGQEPRHLREAGNTKGWLWLGCPGWYGNMAKAEQALVQDYVAQARAGGLVPEWPNEYSEVIV